jgi:hypothetical protein
LARGGGDASPRKNGMSADITKDKLITIIRQLLKTDTDLRFLQELRKEDLERLVAAIRDRVDRVEK